MEDTQLVEGVARSRGGVPILVGSILVALASVAGFIASVMSLAGGGSVGLGVTGLIAAILVLLATIFVGIGVYTVQPNQSAVLTLSVTTGGATGSLACAGPTRCA